MTQRNDERAQAQQTSVRQLHPRVVAGSAAPPPRSTSAKQLLDSGAITEPEFQPLKQKALAL